MIVPSTRLLMFVSSTLVPMSIIGAVLDRAILPCMIISLILAIIVLLDAAFAYKGLDGIDVSLPERVHMSKDHEGLVRLELKNTGMKQKRLCIGLALPPGFNSPHETIWTTLDDAVLDSSLNWPCTPAARGSFFVDACHLESGSRLGLWAFRDKRPSSMEIRVYPNLYSERKNLSWLFLNRYNFGAHPQRQVGKGREFEKLREYIPGDSYEDIHWKATAKRRFPITKVFQIERTQEVYVLIDESRLSARRMQPHSGAIDDRNMPGEPVIERFITSALILALAAQKQGDLFGLMTFSDRVQRFIRARSGKAHYNSCRDALYNVQPERVNPDFNELCSIVRLKLRRRALLIILTNLDDPVLAENFINNMELISRQHLILVNMPRPYTARPLFTNTSVRSIEDIGSELGNHILWHDLQELERVLYRHGVQFNLLEAEKMCVDMVSRYINVKQRQVL